MADGAARASGGGRGGRGRGGRAGRAGGQRGEPGDPEQPAAPFPGADAATADLEAIVFGRAAPKSAESAAPGAKSASQRPLLAAASARETGDSSDEDSDDGAKAKGKRKRKAVVEDEAPRIPGGVAAAWADPDDEALEVDLASKPRTQKLRRSEKETKVTGVEYEERLREQFGKLHGNVRWAEKKTIKADSDSSDDEAPPATSAKVVTAGASGNLQPGEIDIARLREVQIEPGAKTGPAVIQSLQFHPSSELLLTAGLDKKLRLFAVDAEENPKVSTYFFKKFPICDASFTPDGDQVLLTGFGFKMWGLDVRTGTSLPIRHMAATIHQKYYGLTVGPSPQDAPGLRSSQMYSVLGDAGTVLVCDVKSKQPIRTLRMSTPGVASVFSPEQDTLFTADEECNIYEWDLATGRCRQRVKESWAVKISSLAMNRTSAHSPTPYLAVGTTSGNVDMFDISGPSMSAQPTNTIGNLTTSITGLKFHHDGELLATYSRQNKDALKLVHTGTSTVFKNWPTSKTPLHKVSALDFSHKGGLMAIGNERGRVLLYRVNHYQKPRLL